MPKKLKRLVAHGAAAKHKPFEPGRVRRQQQSLLYGSGAAVTAFILVCAALVVRLDIQDYLAQARSTFLQRNAQLYAGVQAIDRLLMVYGDRTEQLWHNGAQPSPEALRTFSAAHGRLTVRVASGAEPFFAMAEITPDRPAESYAQYLGAILGQIDTSVRQRSQEADAEPIGGYVIGLDGPFLGVLGEGLVARARALPPDTDVKVLIAALMPTGITRQKPDMRYRSFRLDRRFDPIVGRTVVRFARRLDDAAGRPVGWLVFNSLSRFDDVMSPRSDDEDVAVVAIVKEGRSILFGRERDPAMIDRATNNAREALGENVVVRRVGTRFLISDHLPISNLVLVTTFSWRSVAEATGVRVSVVVGASLIGIALLWLTIVTFDLRALRPANRRAIRLIESEAFNRTLIRNAPAGLLLLSVADGETMVRNDAVLAYDGGASELPLGKRIWQAYRERHAGAGGRGLVVHQELAVERTDRETAYLAAHIVRTRFRGVDALLCTLTDVTARKLTEDKLREARAAAEDANKAKSTFLATMSHEIRTPLNAIVGNLELMERAPLPPNERRRLKTIMSSSDTLLRVINDVLDLSKAESNQMTLERIPFDLRALLRDVAAIFRPIADAKHLTLECRMAFDLADGYVGDPTRLRQLVSNLVSNAIKFTKRGGITIAARIATDGAGARCVEIAVRDTGIGIPEDALPTLFDVYIQADPSVFRRFGGTGLGLPLCRRIVKLMHGELTVESRVDEGTTFVAALPLPSAPADWRDAFAEPDAAPESGQHPADDAHDDMPPLRVLVAEDHPASRALLRDQFDALGHDATIVTNGIEAMRAFFEHPFDVVLTDLGMPELDGFTLMRFLREQGVKVPVIAMTAHATDEDYRRCEQAGAAEVVLKPLSIDVLDAVLTRRTAARGQAAVSNTETASSGHADNRPVLSDEIHETLRAATLHSLAVIGDAMSTGKVDPVKIELHSMRGGFALVGDVDARDACAEMERAVNEGGMDEFGAHWPGFRDRIGQALSRLAGDAAG
ncbi:ATP-binding protein [Burkholderia sp. PU8-34]